MTEPIKTATVAVCMWDFCFRDH